MNLTAGVTINPLPKDIDDWTTEKSFVVAKGSRNKTYTVKVTVDGKNIIKVNDGNIKTTINTERGKADPGQTGNFNHIDVSEVTTMNDLFLDQTNFNGDITKWDTSKVTNMTSMFDRATDFNQDIGSWNTAEVVYMYGLFRDATNFNKDLSSWNTAKTISMTNMFRDATKFNQDLSSWDVSKTVSCNNFSTGATAWTDNSKKPNFTNCSP